MWIVRLALRRPYTFVVLSILILIMGGLALTADLSLAEFPGRKFQGKLVRTAVTPGHDFGNQIEIVGGLKPNDQVIVNPPDSIVDGQTIQIVQATLPGETK